MRFIDEIYVGENIKSLETIVCSLNRKIPVLNIYCICLCNASKLEILSTREMFSEKNRKKKYVIIGIAGGKDQSYLLFKKIIENLIEKNIELKNIKKYFNELEVEGID